MGTFTSFKKILGDYEKTFRKDKIMILSITNCETVTKLVKIKCQDP